MSYLTNPYCNFITHFKYNPNKKYNIISASFFKMKKHYKYFGTYISGLKNIIKYRKELFPDFKIRIFVDGNIMRDDNIKKILFADKNVQVVEYNCPDFLSQDDKFHQGTFGTLVRFFPMFDFDNNDAKEVMVWDIDLKLDSVKKIHRIYTYIKMNMLTYSFVYNGNMFMGFDLHYKYPYIIADRIFCLNKKFPKDNINNFLKNLHQVKVDNPLYEWRIKEMKDTNVQFGIDETYLYKYLLPELLNSTEFTVGCYTIYGIALIFWYNKDNIPNNADTPIYLKQILGKYYDKTKNIEENILIIDDATYEAKEINEKNQYIAERFYKLIKEFCDNKDYSWLSNDLLDVVCDRYMGVIYEESIYDMDTNKKNIYVQVKLPTHVLKRQIKNNYYKKYIKYKKKYLDLKKSR